MFSRIFMTIRTDCNVNANSMSGSILDIWMALATQFKECFDAIYYSTYGYLTFILWFTEDNLDNVCVPLLFLFVNKCLACKVIF